MIAFLSAHILLRSLPGRFFGSAVDDCVDGATASDRLEFFGRDKASLLEAPLSEVNDEVYRQKLFFIYQTVVSMQEPVEDHIVRSAVKRPCVREVQGG